jgi:pyridoxal biosynthesis lyase PdxS
MSADLEGGKFVGCGKVFVSSGIFKSPTASEEKSSMTPSRAAERAVSNGCPPLPEAD